ncbi:hypothetical protein PENARI_c005G01511 [Penicillium arizonense]|uniref:Uncharacterized protein n=1 Tax=Penicillium arizonense TaxID=1835702 RepID=A0A1F5LPC9_PENAI|nr:hypothetical protein PENARI_c005G01511 [Penicillium arizonense]OGE54751.1 hypothetical protein PENARI_c005G01511 [Penicillium arizonense]
MSVESTTGNESTAYHQLETEGLCERGLVPDFYGTITGTPALLRI